MRLIGKTLTGAALLALAGCTTSSGEDGCGGVDHTGANRMDEGIVSRGAVDGAKLTLDQAVSIDTVPVAVGSDDESWARNVRAVAEIE